MVLLYLTIYLRGNNFIPSPYTIYENKSQCIQDWIVRLFDEVILCEIKLRITFFKEGNPKQELVKKFEYTNILYFLV